MLSAMKFSNILMSVLGVAAVPLAKYDIKRLSAVRGVYMGLGVD